MITALLLLGSCGLFILLTWALVWWDDRMDGMHRPMPAPLNEDAEEVTINQLAARVHFATFDPETNLISVDASVVEGGKAPVGTPFTIVCAGSAEQGLDNDGGRVLSAWADDQAVVQCVVRLRRRQGRCIVRMSFEGTTLELRPTRMVDVDDLKSAR